MKKLLCLIACVALVAGCATWQDAGGKTLASIDVTVDAGMRGWFAYTKNHEISEAEHARVKALYEKYQLAFEAMEQAYIASVKVKDKSIFEQAKAAAMASKDELLTLIKTFSNRTIITQ